MLRRTLTVLSALCLTFGGVQGGRGLWIYAKAELAQILLHRAWGQVKAGEERARPWPWADAWPVARLQMPDRGVDQIVLSGASGRNLAFAPGHLHGSAASGEDGTCVIAGHRDTHFTVLEEIEPGERIVLERPDGVTTTYRVQATDVVDESDTYVLADHGGSTLVLITCWPFDTPIPGGPLRYVVFAQEDDPDPVPNPSPRPRPRPRPNCSGSVR